MWRLPTLIVVALIVSPIALFAQVIPAASPTGSLTSPPGEWQSSIVLSFFTTTMWEALKKKSWIRFSSDRVAFWAQRAGGVLIAAATAAGLSYTFDPAAGRLVIDGLTMAAALGAIKDTAWQFVVNEAMYKKLVKPDAKKAEATQTYDLEALRRATDRGMEE